MSDKYERLVEELDTMMIQELYCGESTWDELDEEDRATVTEAWTKAITLISQAIADGLPLAGEVGRAEVGGGYAYPEELRHPDLASMITCQPITWWTRDLLKATTLQTGDILIAFRKGQEEQG